MEEPEKAKPVDKKTPEKQKYPLEFKKQCAKEAAKLNNNTMVARTHLSKYANLNESDVRRWRKLYLTEEEMKKSLKRRQSRHTRCYYLIWSRK